jgi:hypothetical protein
MSKAKLQAQLDELGIGYDPEMTNAELKELLNSSELDENLDELDTPDEPELPVSVQPDEPPREAKSLGVTQSKVNLAGFKDKSPDKVEKEAERHAKLVEKRTKNRIAKAKAKDKASPLDLRKGVLTSRLKAVKSRRRARTYSTANVKAWIEELNLINNTPKAWMKATKSGLVPYSPGNKKKRTAQDLLDAMDLDD